MTVVLIVLILKLVYLVVHRLQLSLKLGKLNGLLRDRIFDDQGSVQIVLLLKGLYCVCVVHLGIELSVSLMLKALHKDPHEPVNLVLYDTLFLANFLINSKITEFKSRTEI